MSLVCFPHAGGTAAAFASWPEGLPERVEVLAVQYPGRASRLGEPLVKRMDVLAHRIAEALAGLRDRPLALFGHSMGAAVAFEVARRLEAIDPSAVRSLFVSGLVAPHRLRPAEIDLDDDDALMAEILRLGATEDLLLANDELRCLFLEPVRNDCWLMETYEARTRPRLRTPVTAFVGDGDARAIPDDVRSWEELTEGGFTLRVFPGGHFYLVEQRAALLREIARLL